MKRLYFSLILALVALSGIAQHKAPTDTARYRIRYVINIPEIDSTYVDNAARISDLRDFLLHIKNDSTLDITDVEFRGTASPDGSYEFNVWLSENRLRTFKELVNRYIDIPDEIIHADTSEIPWDEFRQKVAESNISHRDEVLAIIDEPHELVPWVYNRHIDSRLLKLKKLYKGTVWEELKSPILEDLRYGSAVFTITSRYPIERFALEPVGMKHDAITLPTDINIWRPQTWTPRIYLKTNLAAWVLFSANAAIEADLAPHWSFTVPVSYCAWDWIKSTIKFRNFGVQPEFRYWFNSKANDGWFLGAHFGWSFYNVAFNGEHRYQDWRGRTPAMGGGIAAGWRKAFGHNNAWRVEFALGAGAYHLDYSVFENTPDVKDGQWIERRKKTYIGLDQVAITIGYAFDLNRYARTTYKKGGEL